MCKSRDVVRSPPNHRGKTSWASTATRSGRSAGRATARPADWAVPGDQTSELPRVVRSPDYGLAAVGLGAAWIPGPIGAGVYPVLRVSQSPGRPVRDHAPAGSVARGRRRRVAGHCHLCGRDRPLEKSGALGEPTTLVADAHAAGLFVHVWTLRADPSFLPKGYGGDPEAEVRRMIELGVDGVFTDFPDIARRVILPGHAPGGRRP